MVTATVMVDTTAADVPAHTGAHLLEADLTIPFVESAHRRLAHIWVAPEPAIDVSRVVAIDTAGVQLLLGLVGEAANRGTALRIEGYSAAISNALKALGMSDVLPMAPANGK
jgi:ABC-type transporter Mla MlaB component